jgi:hypothetical protein
LERTRPFLASLARKAAQVWNEWIHEEDQTLQSGSSNNSNSTASMSVTEEALRNTQQQQQLKQPCYNDRINSPNRLHRFSAESPLVSILPFTNAQMQQFPKRTSTEFIAQNRYAQQDAYRSYHMFRYYSSSNAHCNRMVVVRIYNQLTDRCTITIAFVTVL